MYDDDLVSGCNERSEGKTLNDKSKAIILEAGFDLRKMDNK